MGWKVKKTKKPHQGFPLILDVREVESELIPGGIEEWGGGKRIDVFMGKREQPKNNLLLFKSSLDIQRPQIYIQ